MYGIENELYKQLCKLRDEYGLSGIKAEFEAEGSSFRDLLRLRRVTAMAGVKLFLKIGGVEAIRDIKDALEINVDGLIAPMVESEFGAKKFIDGYKKVYKNYKIKLTLNIETKNAIDQIDAILNFAVGSIENITIGRSDLSGSYLNKEITPESDFIYDILEEVGQKVNDKGMTFTIGGSVSSRTVNKMSTNDILPTLITSLETRKVIFPTNIMLYKNNAIREALKFEELYILSKKEFSDMHIESEIARLTELKRRM